MVDGLAARLWLAAVVCFAAVAALGGYAAFRPLGTFDTAGFALRGTAVEWAFAFTKLGRWPALLSLSVVAVAIAMLLNIGMQAVLTLLVVQVVSQGANSAIKLLFRRMRPDEFVGERDVEYSFPSGHSLTAVVFFVGFALLVLAAPLPRPLADAVAAILIACALGIPWSRLALGAHYATDVTGGLLFGAGWLCLLFGLLLRTGTTAGS